LPDAALDLAQPGVVLGLIEVYALVRLAACSLEGSLISHDS